MGGVIFAMFCGVIAKKFQMIFANIKVNMGDCPHKLHMCRQVEKYNK